MSPWFLGFVRESISTLSEWHQYENTLKSQDWDWIFEETCCPESEAFKGNAGPNNLPDDATALELFELFWDDQMMEILIDELNSIIHPSMVSGSAWNNSQIWPVTKSTFLTWIACWLEMHQQRMPSVKDYFANQGGNIFHQKFDGM